MGPIVTEYYSDFFSTVRCSLSKKKQREQRLVRQKEQRRER